MRSRKTNATGSLSDVEPGFESFRYVCLKGNIHNVRNLEGGCREDFKGGRIVERRW